MIVDDGTPVRAFSLHLRQSADARAAHSSVRVADRTEPRRRAVGVRPPSNERAGTVPG
ncbi:hypothetical protein [Natronobeatus ordinarius]|uniref:hypothetical protein n=1 Tax=Natronobeatus ordinarius TaxID=2963433 RepID=UPI0020CD581D|nr:hypothetical protein [Natronobeatus ordinarius]